MLKQAVKAVLPRPIVSQCIEIKDRLRLGRVPSREFQGRNLRSLSSVSLPRIFSDPEINAAWEEDHARISAFYPQEEIALGVNPGDRRAIYFLIMALRPRSVLEIGTHIGASAIYIATALRRVNEGGRITTIDVLDVNDPERGPWKKAGIRKSPINCAKDLGVSESISFHVGPGQTYMKSATQHFDLIFLDGDHDAWAVYEEMSLALSVLGEDGVIMLHDYYPDGKNLFPTSSPITGPFRALERVQSESPNIHVLPLGNLPWPTKQGTSVTTLALVLGSRNN